MSETGTALEQLGVVLRSAARLVAEVHDDPLLPRLVRAFAAMPPQDREVVIGVLEREVSVRAVSSGTRGMTGWAARPNPNARLYVRAVGPIPEAEAIDHDSMVLAALRGSRVVGLMLQPALHDHFRTAMREAFDLISAEERQALRTVVGELLQVLDDVERAEVNGEPVVLK